MKNYILDAFSVLLFSVSLNCAAQGIPLVIAWQAPVGPDAVYGYNPATCDNISIPCLNCTTGSTHFGCFLNKVLPNISGVGFVIPWGEIDNCSSVTSCTSDVNCHSTGTCYNWAWVDKALMDFVNANNIGGGSSWSNGCTGGRPCKIVLIVWLTQDAGNSNLFNNIPNTPAYVFTQAYADQVGGCTPPTHCAPQDVAVCRGWQGTNTGLGGGWGAQAPIRDTCWSSGSDDVGLWSVNGTTILKNLGGCMQTFGITANFSGYPVMYEKPLITAAQSFLTAMALHYSNACPNSFSDSCGSGPTIAKSIAYMRIGPSSGGENYPYCSCESSTGGSQCDTAFWPGPKGASAEPKAYSDQGYLTAWPPSSGDGTGYVASLYSNIRSQNWAFPIDSPTEKGPASNQSLVYPDIEALLANQYGLGIGMQAASIGDLVTFAAQGSPSTAANWAVHFREFPSVPDHHLQTVDPGGAGQFSITTISSGGLVSCGTGANNDCSGFCFGWVFISGTSNPAFNGTWKTQVAPPCTANSIQLVGSPASSSTHGFIYSGAHLPLLLPFEMQQCQGSLQTICSAELWEVTLDWTYGTNTVSNTIGNPATGDSTYQSAISNFLAGLPSATSFHNNMSTRGSHY